MAVPFRLLGLAGDPGQVAELYGRPFSSYAAGDVEVTVAVLNGGDALESEAIKAIVKATPHVVVACGPGKEFTDRVTAAFLNARSARGMAGLPAKLYFRARTPLNAAVTTFISHPTAEPELLVRAFPRPWVSGILERDLFSGIRMEPISPAAQALAA